LSKTLPITTNSSFGPLYYVAGTTQEGANVFKAAVYNSTGDVPVSLSFENVRKGAKAQLIVLTGPSDPYGANDPFTHVNVVKTQARTLTAGDEGVFQFSLPNLSVAVLETGASQLRARKEDPAAA